ncbi:hypothetical protein Bca101_089970 [Brassica carinata]
MAELRMTHMHATEDELRQLRDNGFAAWLRSYVNDGLARGLVFDDWSAANLCRDQTMWSNHILNFVREDMHSQGKVILRQHMMLVFHLLR